MTGKDTVAAREDQPQLGTCNAMTGNNPHTQEPGCINWRPEDQPRPTPPVWLGGFVKMAEQLEAAGIHSPEEFYVRMRQAGFGKIAATEAQSEAPQSDKEETIIALTESHANWAKRCGRVEAKLVKLWDAAQEFYASDSAWKQSTRDKLRDTLGQILKETEPSDEMLTRVETGAHPSQDASPVHGPFMDKAADYLREWSNRYKRIGDDAIIDWSGSETQYHLANFAGRMSSGSTPSPDPPQLSQSEPCGKKLANGGNCADILCDLQVGHEGWCSRTFPAVLTNVHEQLDTMRLSKDLFKAKFESANIEIERLREALRLVLDELHEINLANSHGNKPRNPEMTVFAEVQGLAALAPSLPTKEK